MALSNGVSAKNCESESNSSSSNSIKESEQKTSLHSTYDNLIASLSTEGFWSDKGLILGFFKDTKVAKDLLSQHDTKVILTLLALHILSS